MTLISDLNIIKGSIYLFIELHNPIINYYSISNSYCTDKYIVTINNQQFTFIKTSEIHTTAESDQTSDRTAITEFICHF